MTSPSQARAPKKCSGGILTRRKWLGCCGLVASGWIALGRPVLYALSAPTVPLPEVTRSMLAITDGGISQERLENATALFGVILETSKELRAIDLGDMEPAVEFTHAVKGRSDV